MARDLHSNATFNPILDALVRFESDMGEATCKGYEHATGIQCISELETIRGDIYTLIPRPR